MSGMWATPVIRLDHSGIHLGMSDLLNRSCHSLAASGSQECRISSHSRITEVLHLPAVRYRVMKEHVTYVEFISMRIDLSLLSGKNAEHRF
jgi:hypothetical protein